MLCARSGILSENASGYVMCFPAASSHNVRAIYNHKDIDISVCLSESPTPHNTTHTTMSNEDEESAGFLRRLRQFANEHVSSTLHSLIGLPSILSRPASSSWATSEDRSQTGNCDDNPANEISVKTNMQDGKVMKEIKNIDLGRMISHDERESGPDSNPKAILDNSQFVSSKSADGHTQQSVRLIHLGDTISSYTDSSIRSTFNPKIVGNLHA